MDLLGFLYRTDPLLKDFFEQTINKYISDFVPGSASLLIKATLSEITQNPAGRKFSLALLFTVWSASSGMSAIMEGLNIAYGIKETRSWFKKKLAAFILTIVCGGFMAVSLIILISGERLGQFIWGHLIFRNFMGIVGRIIEGLLVIVSAFIFFNILYVYAPNIHRRQWHWFMPGTMIGVGIWLMSSLGFKLYLSVYDRYTLTYGSLGAVIVLIMWFYLTGIAILTGAEVNSEIEKASGMLDPDGMKRDRREKRE